MASPYGLPFFYSTFLLLLKVSIKNFIPPQPGDNLMGQPGCRIYLIRHGETVNAGEVCLNGHFDVELSPAGEEQIRRVAKALQVKPVKAIYSSDLKRTRVSAEILSRPHNLEPVCYPELRELSFGKWEGLSVKVLNQRYPGELSKRFKNPETFCADGGETFLQLQERALPKFLEIAGRHPGEEIVIMSHGGVNRVILAHLLGSPLSHAFRISQEYAAINVIQFCEDQPAIELLNGATHHLS